MSKKHRAESKERKSSMERRAEKMHKTGGGVPKVHQQRARLMMYAVTAASAWTVLCIVLAATGTWRWNEGVIFTSHIAILPVFGALTLYAIWVNKDSGAYGLVVWMMLIYDIVITLLIVLTI